MIEGLSFQVKDACPVSRLCGQVSHTRLDACPQVFLGLHLESAAEGQTYATQGYIVFSLMLLVAVVFLCTVVHVIAI